jgi:hypothetical protein
MENVIDINLCDALPGLDDTRRIGAGARTIARAEYGWERLVAQLRPVVQT